MPHEALRRTLAQAPELQWIHTASAGFNWVLIPEVEASPIVLTRTAHVLNQPIAEYVVAVTLALVKGVPQLLDGQRRRAWARPQVGTLKGRTLVVIGAGAIGSEVAHRFRAFGMRTLGVKRRPEPMPEFDDVVGPSELGALLPQADVLVVACPLTPETRHLLGRAEFARMNSEAILVNVARGEILVEEHLIEALEGRLIAGAALDVFTVEPLPEASPLWALPNVIISPHASYLSPHNERGLLEEFAENLRRFLSGEPLMNQITSRELGY